MKAEFMERRIQDGPVQPATRRLFCAYYRLPLAFDGRDKSHQLSQPVAGCASEVGWNAGEKEGFRRRSELWRTAGRMKS
jgi:hypothetical protein